MMESWEGLMGRIPILLVVSLVVAVLGYGIAVRLPVSYDVHFSYVVSIEQREVAPIFRYDGYYALSATDLFAGTLASWIVTPETVVAAYHEAGITLPTEDAIDLTKNILAEKAASQLVKITVKNPSKQKAESLAKGVMGIVPKLIEQYNKNGTPAVTFSAVASIPWTGVSRIAPLPIAIVLFVFVFFAGIFLTLFMSALARGSS